MYVYNIQYTIHIGISVYVCIVVCTYYVQRIICLTKCTVFFPIVHPDDYMEVLRYL